MATTDQVVFLKALQQYEEGLDSLVKHYNEIARDLKDLNDLFKITHNKCDTISNKVSIKFEE